MNGEKKYPTLMEKFNSYRKKKDIDEFGVVSMLNKKVKELLFNKKHMAIKENEAPSTTVTLT